MSLRVVAVIQARMGATRLPNKMMLWLHGLPVVEWVWRRVSKAERLDAVVFALPDTPHDDLLAGYLQKIGATVFRGSEADVLGRFYGAAVAHRADLMVRVCADNPFVAASEIDRLVGFFLDGHYDYAYNHIPHGNCYPDGLGAEITPMAVLGKLHREARLPGHREHLFNYLWDHVNQFRIGTCDPLNNALAHPELKLDLDTIEDYARLLHMNVTPETSATDIVAAALLAHKKGIKP